MNSDNMAILMDLALKYCALRDRAERAEQFMKSVVPSAEEFYAEAYDDITNPPGMDNGVVEAYQKFDQAVYMVLHSARGRVWEVKEATDKAWVYRYEEGVLVGGSPEVFLEHAWNAYREHLCGARVKE